MEGWVISAVEQPQLWVEYWVREKQGTTVQIDADVFLRIMVTLQLKDPKTGQVLVSEQRSLYFHVKIMTIKVTEDDIWYQHFKNVPPH